MAFCQNDNRSCDSGWIQMDDSAKLFLRRWKVSGTKAVLHIIHGMAEHSARYSGIAGCLADAGIEVWAADQRGHGETALNKDNGPALGGLLGHCADSDGLCRVTLDIDILNKEIMKEHPAIPVFLFGHSWGSFITQNYIEIFDGKASGNENPVRLSGCILSGTRGPDGIKIPLGAIFLSLLAFLGGKRKGSLAAKALADGPYNRAFRPSRTEFDWLSRDEKIVDAYIADPQCGFLCSLGFYRDMARALNQIHKPDNMGKIRKDLPVYIFLGSADPVGDFGASPAALAAAYRQLGIADLETVIYPDARHETFNEANRQEVTGNLVSWLLRHCT